MNATSEQTETTILDKLEESPNVLFGVNASELFMIFGSLIAFFVVVFLILFGMLGIAIGFAVGGALGVVTCKKVGVKKSGRQSYLFWGEVKRNLQLNGINLGIGKVKIPFGFICDCEWDNVSHKTRFKKLKSEGYESKK